MFPFHPLTFVAGLCAVIFGFTIDRLWLGLPLTLLGGFVLARWHRGLEERLQARVPPVIIEPHVTVTHEPPGPDARAILRAIHRQPPGP